MSIKFCEVSESGFHSFGHKAGSREPACRHCGMTKKQLQEKDRQVGNDYLEHVKGKVASPEGVAEIDAMRPYIERRQRFIADVNAMSNLAANHFGTLPDPVSADVRSEVAQALDALKKAVAGVKHPEIREALFFSQFLAEFSLGVMNKRMEAFQQRGGSPA